MTQSSSLLKLLALVFISMLVNFSQTDAITCNDVNMNIAPCLGYIHRGGQVTSGCCNGVKTNFSTAKTKADRQAACSCIKSLAAKATNPQLRRAQNIPKACGVNVPFPISRRVDCSKVN